MKKMDIKQAMAAWGNPPSCDVSLKRCLENWLIAKEEWGIERERLVAALKLARAQRLRERSEKNQARADLLKWAALLKPQAG